MVSKVGNYIMFIYCKTPKSKKRKIPAQILQQEKEWLESLKSNLPKFSRKSSMNSVKLSKPFPVLGVPPGRETPYFPSKNSADFSPAIKKGNKVYTGDKMIGIGTLHKSNAVPVFSDTEAKDMAKMRR